MEDLPVFTLNTTVAPEPRFDFSEPLRAAPIPDTHGALALQTSETPQSLSALSDLRPLGQIHDSFIIAAGRDGLWIIDQHVAHERILFEKVLRQQAEGRVERQQLLMPILLDLTAGQQIEYARIAAELERAGFDSEPFGNRTIAVKGAPAGVGPADIERLVFEILEIAESELRKVSLDDLRRAMAASIACRAAIKINMRLEHTKMEWLLNELAATDCPMSCPHGRPIALRYSTRDILKSFHRI
jgi:DNA mismatch repair protein MutL